MKDYLKTMRQQGMQQQMQNKETPGSKYFSAPDVEINGNQDAKVLAKAYSEFAKGGLTIKERETIEKIDDLVQGADIVISKDGNAAVIAQEDGKSFNVQAPYNKAPITKRR